jgi:hypothetical protein
MVSNLDIWRGANLLIQEHGADAELEAARRQDLMLDRGDDEGRLVWARIRRAIEARRAPIQWQAELRGTAGLRGLWEGPYSQSLSFTKLQDCIFQRGNIGKP